MKTHVRGLGLVLAIAAVMAGCSDDSDGSGPKCYTPCQTGAVVGGEYVPCSHEGLLEGCLGATKCVDGWCVFDSKADPAGATNLL